MMLRMSFGLPKEADAVEQAVEATLQSGVRTKDIAHGGSWLTCDQMTDKVLEQLA